MVTNEELGKLGKAAYDKSCEDQYNYNYFNQVIPEIAWQAAASAIASAVRQEMDADRTKKALDAENRGNKWLSEGNAAKEKGNLRKAEKCYAKGQYWLDRYNKLTGRS